MERFPVLPTPERLGAGRLVFFDLMQGIGLRTLDGATRLFELNMRATRTLADEAAVRLKAALDPQARASLPVYATPSLERATSYSRDVYEILVGTNAEIAELVQQHVRTGWTDEPARSAKAAATPEQAAAAPAAGPVEPADDRVEAAGAAQGDDPTKGPFPASAFQTAPRLPEPIQPAPLPEPAQRVEAPALSEAAPTSNAVSAAHEATPDAAPVLDAAPTRNAVPALDAAPAPDAAPGPDAAAVLEALPVPVEHLPDPPAALATRQPLAQAVHGAIEQAAGPGTPPVVPEVLKRPRTPRIGRAVSRKSTSNAP